MGRKPARILLAAAAACGWVNFALAGGGISIATWTNSSPGNWNDGFNWSSNPLVPNNALGVGWTAFLSSSADATLDVDVVLDHLDTYGSINTNGRSLTANNTLDWSGGAIVGAGAINLTGVTNLNGDTKSISQVTINAGSLSTTNWTAGGIGPIDDEGGTFNNAGLFIDSTDASWTWIAAQTPVFNNTGTYRKSAGTAASNKEVEAVFNNSGFVDVQTSDLWLSGGGMSSGSFNVAAGARLLFSDFSENFSGAGAVDTRLTGTSSILSNGGVVFSNLFGNARSEIAGDFDSAVLTVDPGVLGEVTFRSGSTVNQTIIGDLDMRGGRLTFNTLQSNGVTFDNIDLTGGQIEGGDEVSALGAMTWTGGTIRGASTQAFTAFGALTISGENPKSLIDRAFYSTDAAISSGGNMQFDSADIVNSPAAIWDVIDDMDFADLAGTFVGRFYNDGTFTKSGGTTDTTFDRVEFNNAGVVHVNAATLNLAGGGSSTGTFNVSSAGALRIGGDLQYFLGSTSKIIGPSAARLIIADAAHIDHAGSINIGVLELRDAAQFFDGGGMVIATMSITINEAAIISKSSGTIETGTLNLTGGGQFNMSAGPVGVSTTLKVNALNIDTPTLSQLDLADNRLIIDYSGASPLTTIRGDIQQGFNTGAWNGNRGILSNDAAIASSTSTKTGIGYVEATNIFTTFPASFGGYAIDNTTLLARYTLLGDSNLDLTVNISDFSRLAANFNLAGPWFNGDFNYDGTINISDFASLAANFNKSLPSDLPRQSIPEPSAIACMLTVAAVALQCRCRRE